ncbi:MAG: exodeoxyribonuclease VII small subunit, partial [Chlamydiota bacterium]|nr:exodeoxyribonuclease VII small subunit [Chlamydiota bacterium]
MKNVSFEQALEKIESVVTYLESDSLDIEKALKKYEEGIKLIRYCQKKLGEYEKKIELLNCDSEGNIKRKN